MKYKEFLEEQLRNPEFKKEYDALQPEYEIIEAILAARIESGLTQKELSKLTGIAQSDLSKIETGNANPSLKTMKRIAEGLGKKLEIRFV